MQKSCQLFNLFINSSIGCSGTTSPKPKKETTPKDTEKKETEKKETEKKETTPKETEKGGEKGKIEKADFTLTAEQLAKDYTSEAAGDKKYKDKRLRVTGVIKKVELKDGGVASVVLKGAGKIDVEGSIGVADQDQFKGVKEGQKITIQGRCIGLLGEVSLHSCERVE